MNFSQLNNPQTNLSRPLGDQTTIIDLADRDEMDDTLFPLTATQSWFTRTKQRRILPFTPVLQEFTSISALDFGQKLVFNIGSVNAGDLLFSVALQIQLGHWLPNDIINGLQTNTLNYVDPQSAWYYANSLGSVIIQRADFIIEDQIIETIDGDFSNIYATLFHDLNIQFGIANDAYGKVDIPSLINQPPGKVFPTSNGFITCILPFTFQRIRLQNGFPLISCREKTVRIEITLRPFSECVRIASGLRASCDDTPLGKTFVFQPLSGPNISVTASSTPPVFADARLVTYGIMTDGKLRTALLKAPFERLFREIQAFQFSEPKKYVINTGPGMVRLQLPIEVNGPLEEIIWVIRRKAVSLNNEWTNYGSVLESEWSINTPSKSMLTQGTIQVNGISLIESYGDYFRRSIAKDHKGGIVAYNSFIYGYSFAEEPGKHNPSGWINTSKTSDVRLRMDISPPNGSEDLEFEVLVYCISLNWIRFENGIANKLFNS